MKYIFCPKCDMRVSTDVFAANVFLEVKRTNLCARQLQAVCPYCGDSIADEEMSQFNLNSAFRAYRESMGLLSADEIKHAYARYNLTQSSFAKLLGLGGATLSRYEHGSIQTKLIDGAIRSASEPANMLSLLEERGEMIPNEQVASAREIALSLLAGEDELASRSSSSLSNFSIVFSTDAPSVKNGFRTFDWERVSQMIVFLAGQCNDLGRTKLNKAMFYSDFVCFAETSCSMSGLVYARATHGPVVDGYDALFGEMVREGLLVEQTVEQGPYEVSCYAPSVYFEREIFSQKELTILEKVATFINGFNTAKELSDYSHKEKCWKDRVDGETLSYMDAFYLNQLELFAD